MNSLFRYLMNLAVVSGLWIMCFPGVSMSYQPIPAELTANINIRETPDIKSKSIMPLTKGDRILIHNETPRWAFVVYEKNGHQTDGWVSTQHLQKIPNPYQDLRTKDVEVKPASPVPQPVSVAIPINPSQHSGSGLAQASEKQAIDSEPLKPSEKTLPRTQIPLSGDDVTSFFKNKESSPVIVEDSTLKPGSNQASTYEFVGVITRFLFKISIVVTSCFALIFSYSALQIAKSNRYADHGEKIIR